MTVRRWKKSDPREREGQRGKFPDAGAADVLPDPVLGHVVRERAGGLRGPPVRGRESVVGAEVERELRQRARDLQSKAVPKPIFASKQLFYNINS